MPSIVTKYGGQKMEGKKLLTQSKFVIDTLLRFNVIKPSTEISFEISYYNDISIFIYGEFDDTQTNQIKFAFEDFFGSNVIEFYDQRTEPYGSKYKPHVNIAVKSSNDH